MKLTQKGLHCETENWFLNIFLHFPQTLEFLIKVALMLD